MVAVDEKATLRCRPPKGEPEAHVRWVKDGEKLAQSSRVSVSEQGDLFFAHTQKSDTGMYTCIAYNKAGEKESNPVKLSVLGKFQFHIHRQVIGCQLLNSTNLNTQTP